MNRLVLLFTILLVAVCMVAALPIPKSFHQHQLAKRCNKHRNSVPHPSAVPPSASKYRKIQPVPIDSPGAVHVLGNNGKETSNKLLRAEKPVEVTHIALPTMSAPAGNKIQATQVIALSGAEPKATTTSSEKAKTTSSTTSAKPTTTTTTQEPTTTTTTKEATTTTKKPTTTTKKPTTTTTKKASQTSPSDKSSGSVSLPFSGDGTWYNPGLGSCGIENSESDFIAAMNYQQMENGANPNNNPNCGRKVQIKGPSGTVTVTVTDTCPSCAYGSVDLSPAAFEKIASLGDGRVTIHWNWL